MEEQAALDFRVTSNDQLNLTYRLTRGRPLLEPPDRVAFRPFLLLLLRISMTFMAGAVVKLDSSRAATITSYVSGINLT